MAEQSTIEWTDATWNPITGCTLVSEGCRHCYAATLAATRLKHHPSREGLARINAAGEAKFTGEVRLNEQWLDQPLRWTRPRMIFVCAHGDLFHEAVPDEWIDRVFAVIGLSMDMTTGAYECCARCDHTGIGDEWGIDWVIVGGESGKHARPMHPDWARSLRDQCQAAGVAYFFKQWGEWETSLDRERDDPDWRADYSRNYVDHGKSRWLNLAGGRGFHGERFHVMRRVGKKAAGRLLDGREWSEIPGVAT